MTRLLSRFARKRRRGQAYTEFIIVLPLLLLLVAGSIGFGQLLYVRLAMEAAAWSGARHASATLNEARSANQAYQAVRYTLQGFGLVPDKARAHVTTWGQWGRGTEIQVRVCYEVPPPPVPLGEAFPRPDYGVRSPDDAGFPVEEQVVKMDLRSMKAWIPGRFAPRPQRGQVLVWIVFMLPVLLALIGLVFDGGMMWNQFRRARWVADGAAVAAASEIDPITYRDRGSGGARRRCSPHGRLLRAAKQSQLAHHHRLHSGSSRSRQRLGADRHLLSGTFRREWNEAQRAGPGASGLGHLAEGPMRLSECTREVLR